MTWQLTQNGSSFSGTLTMIDPTQNVTGRGSVSGSVSGSSLQFTVLVPVGGFDGAYAGCSTSVTGSGSASTSSIAGTYSGTSSCPNNSTIASGNLTLAKQ